MASSKCVDLADTFESKEIYANLENFRGYDLYFTDFYQLLDAQFLRYPFFSGSENRVPRDITVCVRKETRSFPMLNCWKSSGYNLIAKGSRAF